MAYGQIAPSCDPLRYTKMMFLKDFSYNILKKWNNMDTVLNLVSFKAGIFPGT